MKNIFPQKYSKNVGGVNISHQKFVVANCHFIGLSFFIFFDTSKNNKVMANKSYTEIICQER
jgi:hypothetical protein